MLITQYFVKELYRGKAVFVTGGGSGINLGVAKNFAARGANIAICSRNRKSPIRQRRSCVLSAPRSVRWPPT
jgi:NAD(P)-dependent dehydrogenase (short-subunit alcohol dehydrogenase family)